MLVKSTIGSNLLKFPEVCSHLKLIYLMIHLFKFPYLSVIDLILCMYILQANDPVHAKSKQVYT